MSVIFASLDDFITQHRNWSMANIHIDERCDYREASVKAKWHKLANYCQREFLSKKSNFPVIFWPCSPQWCLLLLIKRLNKAGLRTWWERTEAKTHWRVCSQLGPARSLLCLHQPSVASYRWLYMGHPGCPNWPRKIMHKVTIHVRRWAGTEEQGCQIRFRGAPEPFCLAAPYVSGHTLPSWYLPISWPAAGQR